MRSWSAYRAYLKQNPTLPDPAETFKVGEGVLTRTHACMCCGG